MRNKGITLIALVVSIIVLLVLSGTTIATISGKNGILTKAKLAKEMSEISNEKEAIELCITIANMNNSLDSSNKYYIGTELYDKTLTNGNKWNIIVENESQTIYGTGWNFIIKGTEIENYGQTHYNWLVNYYNGEIRKLENNSYTHLMYGCNLAVKDGLVLNIDPINMSDSTSWGKNVKLYGVENGDGYGWDGTEIKFDGINDYIEVYNNFEMNEGITFEFYAKSNGGDIRMLSKTLKNTEGWGTRFRTHILGGNLFQCCMSGENANSDWQVDNKNNAHWIQKENLKSFNSDKGSYITLVVDLKLNSITLYQEGKMVGSTLCSGTWLRNGGLTDSTVPFTIGMMISGNAYIETYSKMSLYACRLYNKILTDSEVKENYEQTVAYHNMIVNRN